MKTIPLALTLLAAGALAAGCSTSSGGSGTSSSSSPANSPTPASASSAGRSTGGASPAASGSTAPASTGVTACTSAHLEASVGGGTGEGASNNHTGLNLRNVGPASCTLYGYPGVSWVAGADGHQVGDAASRGADPTGSSEKTVTLAPGAVASAPLDIVQAAAIPKSQCKPVPVRGLRVYPPGEKAALFISVPSGSGGYGECSAIIKQTTLVIGWLQPGTQPGADG